VTRLGFGLDSPTAGGIASGGTVAPDGLVWDDGVLELAWDDGVTDLAWDS